MNAATCWFLAPELSFPVAAPTVWNSLPAHLRSTLISRRQFRDALKSHLFADAYF